MKINRKIVHGSMWVPIVAVFLITLIVLLYEHFTSNYSGELIDTIFMAFGFMLIGVVVWFPAFLICLLLENLFIKGKFSKLDLLWLLIFESFIPCGIFLLIMGSMGNVEGELLLFLAGLLAQSPRWFYLNYKGRMFRVKKPDKSLPIIETNHQT